MAENMTPAEETKEVVSKNFIEQEIDKDLAEGVYDLSLIHIQMCIRDRTKVDQKTADKANKAYPV